MDCSARRRVGDGEILLLRQTMLHWDDLSKIAAGSDVDMLLPACREPKKNKAALRKPNL